MATLEVHDGRGGVQRVVVSRDQPSMFGSSPKCDLVMTGDGILPFHGRIRWTPRSQKFKIDASPDARYLLVNGHKMSSSSFRLGDEVAVGPYRIYMINEGEAVAPDLSSPAPVRDDRTRVQPPPFVKAVEPPKPRPPEPKQPAPFRRRTGLAASFENDLETAVAELEGQVPASPESPPARDRPRPAKAAATDGPPKRGWSRLRFLLSARANTPGQEQVLSSPLVFTLVLAFVGLVLVGISLYGIIVRTSASRLYNQALENLEDGDYLNAIRRFDEFIAANPKDARAGAARVHRAMANVRQYVGGAGASWSLALEAEQAMAEGASQEPSYRDTAPELAELVIRTGEALADRARVTADAKTLAEAESTVSLHGRIAGEGGTAFLRRSRLPAKLDAARAAVRKSASRTKALAAMDTALKERSSAKVYGSRDSLVGEYPEFAEDRELLARMRQANDLIRQAVKVDPSRRPAETELRREWLGPTTTLVLRESAPGDLPPPNPDGPLVFAVAEGLAVGLDGSTGTPLWQTPVGLATPFPPVRVPGGTSVLAFDARHSELLRLDGRTGKLVWRQSIQEAVNSPPLVLGNQVIQATQGGKLLVVDLATGELTGGLDLGRPLSGTPVADEAGQVFYVAALKDCLFVLTRDPLGCAGVEYLGHAAGSVAASPSRLGRYLVVPENQTLDESRWRVFVTGEDATKLTPVQTVPVRGWTWGSPADAGSVVWATGDRGGVSAYAVGAYGEREPFRLIARINPDAEPSGPAFALARSERELWVASGRSGRYELDPEGGKLKASWTLAAAGPALGPPQAAGPLLVLTQQNTDGPGVGVWGVDPATGNVRWRTVLGAPWPSPPEPSTDGKSLVALGPDGKPLTIPAEALKSGGFVSATLPRPGGFRLPPGPVPRLEGDGWTGLVPAVGSTRFLARAGADAPFQEVPLPAPVAARPVAWGRDLLLPGSDGRAYLVDPLTGETRAEPFVPPYDREKPTRWRAAVPLGGDAVALADDSGRVRRLSRVNDPRPRLVATAEVNLGKGLVTDPASAGDSVVVVTDDGRVRALAARDLSPIGAWPVDSALSQPPVVSAGRVFVSDLNGGLLALAGDGRRLWSVTLQGGTGVVGPPALRGDDLLALTADGTLHSLVVTDGLEKGQSPLGVLPSGGPVPLGESLVVPSGPGSLRPLLGDNPESASRPGGKP